MCIKDDRCTKLTKNYRICPFGPYYIPSHSLNFCLIKLPHFLELLFNQRSSSNKIIDGFLKYLNFQIFVVHESAKLLLRYRLHWGSKNLAIWIVSTSANYRCDKNIKYHVKFHFTLKTRFWKNFRLLQHEFRFLMIL